MNLDQLLPLLNANGPGALIGVLAVLLIQWWLARKNPAPTPQPGPTPNPSPTPTPTSPLLDLLKQILPLLLARKVAPQSFQAGPPDPVTDEYLKLVRDACPACDKK